MAYKTRPKNVQEIEIRLLCLESVIATFIRMLGL
jgi:hypothetical protein